MDQKDIKDLLRAFDKSGLSKLKLKDGEFEIHFQKGFAGNAQTQEVQFDTQNIQVQPVREAVSAPVLNQNESEDNDAQYITSPMVGTFYKAPSPGAAPFVKPGDIIKAGTTVAIIEAMKIMNEIEAEFDCEIVEELVGDGEPVEFDQPLFRVKKI